MRGPSKSLPKYAKHKASGKAVVRLNGTDIYLGPYGTKTSKFQFTNEVLQTDSKGTNGKQLN